MRNALVVALLVLITAECDNGGGSGPVAPGSQGSSATAAVETFTGTVAVGGSDAPRLGHVVGDPCLDGGDDVVVG